MSTGLTIDPFELIRRALNALFEPIQRAISILAEESRAWRRDAHELIEAAKELESEFAKHNERLFGQVIRETFDSAIANLGGMTRDQIDYLELKLSANLRSIQVALEKAQVEVNNAEKAGKTPNLSDIIAKVANAGAFLDPVITQFVPSRIVLEFVSEEENKSKFIWEQGQIVEAHGWGFDRPDGQQLQLTFQIVGADGKPRGAPLPIERIVHKSSRRLLQLALDKPEFEPIPSDKGVLFVCGIGQNDRYEIPIQIKKKEEKRIIGYRIHIWTDEEKSDKIWFELSIVDSTKTGDENIIARKRVPDGRERWASGERDIVLREGAVSKAVKLGDRRKLRFVHFYESEGDSKDRWRGSVEVYAELSDGQSSVVIDKTSPYSLFDSDSSNPLVKWFDFIK